MNMEFERKLPIPKEVKELYPLSDDLVKVVEKRKQEIADIFTGVCMIFENQFNVGDIIGVGITNTVLDYNGSNEYPDSALLISAFNGGFQSDEGDTYSKLVINFDALKSASETKKKFACGATITVAGYSSTGENIGGAQLNIKRHVQIVVDTSAITA